MEEKYGKNNTFKLSCPKHQFLRSNSLPRGISLKERSDFSRSAVVLFLFISIGLGTTAVGHQDHHPAASLKPLSQSQEQHRKERLSRINENYVTSVKPIFVKACFDCHSQKTRFPWYYRLPVAKQLIDSDIAESRKHLDLTGDFPFRGHGTPEEDLKAIGAVLFKNSMPPWRYRILHPGSSLNPTEKQTVLYWLDQSEHILEEP